MTRATGRIHAGDPDKSARLRRVLGVLADGHEVSTLEIMREAQVCAVNSCVAELRVAGHTINCRMGKGPSGGRVWFYRLVRKPAQLSLMPEAA